MAPTTRRSTRSSTSKSPSPSKSPCKKMSSPKKRTSGRVRQNKQQPRIDEALPTSKATTGFVRGGEEETKKILSQDGAEGQVQIHVQMKSMGVKQGPKYEIRDDRMQTPPSTSLMSGSDSTSGASPLALSLGWTTASSSERNSAKGSGASTPSGCSRYSSDGGNSKLGSLLTSPQNSVASSTSSYFSSEVIGQKKEKLTTDLQVAEELQILKDFDLNALYGACRGISRSERYQRALRFKLKPTPSPMVIQILDEHKDEKNYEIEWETCIWDQHDLKIRYRR